jgi:hypothetical protein
MPIKRKRPGGAADHDRAMAGLAAKDAEIDELIGTASGLVDELRLMVFPTVLGTGRRLFGETPAELPFRLVSATAVGDDGVTILVYHPVIDGDAETR